MEEKMEERKFSLWGAAYAQKCHFRPREITQFENTYFLKTEE